MADSSLPPAYDDSSLPPAYDDIINGQKLASPQQNYPHQSSSVAFNAYQEDSLHINVDQSRQIERYPQQSYSDRSSSVVFDHFSSAQSRQIKRRDRRNIIIIGFAIIVLFIVIFLSIFNTF